MISSNRQTISDISPAPVYHISTTCYWTQLMSYTIWGSQSPLPTFYILKPHLKAVCYLQPFRFQEQGCTHNFPLSFQLNSSHLIWTPNSDLFQGLSYILSHGRQKLLWFEYCSNTGSQRSNLSFRVLGYRKIKNKELWLALFTRQNNRTRS